MQKRVGSLLLRLTNADQVVQSIMVAREVYEHEMKKLKDLETEHRDCPNKIQVAEELALKNIKAAIDIQKEFNDFATKVQLLEQKMHDEAHKMATQQIMRTRVEMMLEYHRGEWSSWDIAETVKIYNESYPDDAFSLDKLDADNANEKSPEGGAQNDE